MGRTGTPSGDGSGDLFLAFSTADEPVSATRKIGCTSHLPHHVLDSLFLGVVEAVEEAIVNALVAARTLVGRDGHRAEALDHTALYDLMKAHGQLVSDSR